MKKTILMFLVAALLALTCACATAENATLTVQGAGVLSVDADRATISIGVREAGEQVVDVQSAVNEKMDAVIAALKEMGVDEADIWTNAIGIYPNYDYSADVEVIVGYTGYNYLYVTTADVANVGAYIDAAFAAGANSLDNVEFFVSDTTEAGSQALAMAVENARAKAQVLAEAAGMKLGGIVEIHETMADEYSMPVMYAKNEDDGGGTQVIASRPKVSASVTVSFELVPEE